MNVSLTLFNSNLPFLSMIMKLTNLLHMNFKIICLFGNEVSILDEHAFQYDMKIPTPPPFWYPYQAYNYIHFNSSVQIFVAVIVKNFAISWVIL